MEVQISQSFKVQWLNTTLKFIKDDTQLIKNYPQMPSNHVEYLHNLIWQRKNDIGLGFKSLYSPVWEAMKIYSVKYQFKIVVEKSEDGKSGHLIMEKIPKSCQPDKKKYDEHQVEENKEEMKDTKNYDEKKKKGNEIIKFNEVSKQSKTEVKCKPQEPQSSKKTKTKKSIPKISKGLKMYMENQTLLDSLSPLFIKTKLKSILDFISDELCASKIFINLAPVESRFLENFLSIYQRKNDLEVLLSPACNEILAEISNCYDDFSRTCHLDISVAVNANTNKREVKYTKVPVFPSKKKTKQKLTENSIQTNTKTVSPKDTTKLINKPSISKEKSNITEKNVSKQTKKSKFQILQNAKDDKNGNSKPIDKVIETIDNNVIEALSKFVKKSDDIKLKTSTSLKNTSLNKSVLLPKKSVSFTKEGTSSTIDASYMGVKQNSPKMKILQDMSVPLTSDKALSLTENSIQTNTKTVSPKDTTKLINKPFISKEKSNITEKNVSKQTKKSKFQILQNAVGEDKNGNSKPIDKVIETIDNKVIEALSKFVKKSDDIKPKTSTLKNTSLYKSVLLPKKSISFTKEGTSSTIDTSYIGGKQNSPKMKILQDMSVPLTSNKALRMMQLMGWKGGALGLRGEGITEPIIPIPNYNNSGLGHVSTKSDSNKETKNHLRSGFVNKILDMIDNNIKMSVIKLEDKLIKKEIRFWKLTLKQINKRTNLDVEFENRFEIKDKMIKNPDIIFNIGFEDDNRKIIITKSCKAAMATIKQDTIKETNSEEFDTNVIRNPNSKATFKTIVLKSILELIKSEDNEKLVKFNKELKAKRIRYSNIIISLINEKQNVIQKNSRVVAELGLKVLEALGDIHLSVETNESERYIIIRKNPPPSNNKKTQDTVINKAEDENNKSLFDNVRSNLPTKKKHKLLNRLYKYQTEDTEEFQENQWYSTVDKSLLDSEIIYNVIDDDTKALNNNNNTKIENCNNNDKLEKIHENKKSNKKNIEHDQNNNGDISVNVQIYKNSGSKKIIPKSDLLLKAFDIVREN